MRNNEWDEYKDYFNPSEFDSPDEIGSGLKMKKCFMDKLYEARLLAGVPFRITSGYRTEKYNLKVGGVKDSAHRKFVACDISVKNSYNRCRILKGLVLAGFHRLGIYKNFIHADTSTSKIQDRFWVD